MLLDVGAVAVVVDRAVATMMMTAVMMDPLSEANKWCFKPIDQAHGRLYLATGAPASALRKNGGDGAAARVHPFGDMWLQWQ